MASKWDLYTTSIQSSGSSSDDSSPSNKHSKNRSPVSYEVKSSSQSSSDSIEIIESTSKSSLKKSRSRSRSGSRSHHGRPSHKSYRTRSPKERSHNRRRSKERSHRRHRRTRSRSPHRSRSRSPHSRRQHGSNSHKKQRTLGLTRSGDLPIRNSRSHLGVGRNIMAPQYEDSYRSRVRRSNSPEAIKDRQTIRRELRLEKLVKLSSAPGERNTVVARQLASGSSNIDLEAIRKIVISNDKANPLFTMIMNSVGNLTSIHTPGTEEYINDIMLKVKSQSENCAASEIPKFYNPKSVNVPQIVKQEQKRKLLWGKKEKISNKESKAWGTTEFNSDTDYKKQDKFRKLMGIQLDTSHGPKSCLKSSKNAQMQHQADLFEEQANHYDSARMATHITRGVGLGFAPAPNF